MDNLFSTDIIGNPLLKAVSDFVSGENDIAGFFAIYSRNDEMADYLDLIIDYIADHHIPIKRRTVLMKNVNQNKPFEMESYVERFIKECAKDLLAIDLSDSWKNDPPKVGAYIKTLPYLTAYGAYKIHSIVADIYYQIDPELNRTDKYRAEYVFSLDVLPTYLAGGTAAENYVSQHIISKYPSTMKKGERKQLVKEEIRQAFQREGKGFPRWIQSPAWPMGIDGKPMVYVGQKAFAENSEYYFKDSVTSEILTITQWW